jgi:hypothetical protein
MRIQYGILTNISHSNDHDDQVILASGLFYWVVTSHILYIILCAFNFKLSINNVLQMV